MDHRKLPVYKHKKKILEALNSHQVIVVESPTGSGKTTQLPLILNEAGYADNGVIGVTQPRRIAAVSVCDYIAGQIKSTVPGKVGYKMRFEDKTNEETKIKVMTDGILLQEIKADYNLSKYSVIIVDEAHERSLNIDFILGLLKQILEKRPEFKVIISSATINPEIFSEYFNACPIVHIDSRIFPISVIYDCPDKEKGYDGIIEKIGQIVERIIENKTKGDILIFLSGEKAIKDCVLELTNSLYRKKLMIIPLYGRLSKEEQERVFIKTPMLKTKVVISTNIAETSITINGISNVIDSGFAKMNFYSPRTFTSSLVEVGISAASCNQRKGRAGRTQAGSCYRLYSKKDFDNRPLYTTEEIYRTDLAEVVLRMAEIGIRDFMSFNFISPPGKLGIMGAVETLDLLEALNDDNSLSKNGEMMAEYPLMPRISRIIVEAIKRYPDVLEETIIAASFLSASSPYLLPQGEEIQARKAHHEFRDKYGDFVSYIKMIRAFIKSSKKENFCKQHYLDFKTMSELANIKEQLEDITGSMEIPISSGGSVKDYLCCVSKGLIQFVCTRYGRGRGAYKSSKAEQINIHPGSVMFREKPDYIVAGEIVKTSRMFARSVSPLNKEWLREISPKLFGSFSSSKSQTKEKDINKNRDTTMQVTIGNIVFELKRFKGKKKITVLPWDKLNRIYKKVDQESIAHLKGLKGKIVYNNMDLLKGESVKIIFKIAKYINPETDYLKKWPVSKNYNVDKDLSQLAKDIKYILKICRGKQKTSDLGFVTLHTDEKGNYWFKNAKGYYTALSQSLGSMELLIDSIDENLDKNEFNDISFKYGELNKILNDY